MPYQIYILLSTIDLQLWERLPRIVLSYLYKAESMFPTSNGSILILIGKGMMEW